MFNTTIDLFDTYYRLLDSKGVAGFNKDLGCEVRERIQQLQFIINRVHALETTASAAMARSRAAFLDHIQDLERQELSFENVPVPDSTSPTQDEFRRHHDSQFEMRLLTESFYYLAGRIRTVLRNKRAPLPGLTDFESVGVRDVRNKLLEHAEGDDSKISINSFGWGGVNGPVIKAIRYDGQAQIFPDQGLYRNANEFRDNLEQGIKTAMLKI